MSDETSSQTFLLGGDLSIRRLGYGAMRLCGQPGNFGPYADWESGKRLLRRAVELGVNFIDTAHPYGPGWNEELIADALAPYPPGLIVTTKGGVEKTAPNQVFPDGSPASLRRFCEGSLRRLKLERIDLYQLHRPDPAVPFTESIGALAQLRREGKIRHIGLSNVTLAQLEEARTLVPVASVQNRYNLLERDDDPVLAYCAQHQIAYLPWGPLAAKPFAPEAPLTGATGTLATIAQTLQATTGQVALAWLLLRSPNIILIPGTTSVAHLEENFAASSITLSAGNFAALSRLAQGSE
jgi:aryl-alcohol dehydrogenase-like predicted oxidoreductase